MPTFAELIEKLRATIQASGISRIADSVVAAARPAILIELQTRDEAEIPIGASKIGGSPDLPASYVWPEWKGKPMGFIGQFDLAEASKSDLQGLLPRAGLLSFFYDLYEQPWGYDPKALGFSRIEFFSPDVPLSRRDGAPREICLKSSDVIFSPSITIPVLGSQAYEMLIAETELSDDERDKYWDLPDQLQSVYRKSDNTSHHQLLGHSRNIQGDMQLEAELVTSGLYCGDPSGYNDPRAKSLRSASAQWQLLFQLDSDSKGDLMWGDVGMLYYWMRKTDLANRRFENHWMSLQCY